jgi:hypothetical protein
VDVDPLASMRCWAIEIELGGRAYEVPALSAIEWWPVVLSGDLTKVLDFIESTPGEPLGLDDLLLDGDLDGAELSTALTDAVEEASGRSFHAAHVLASVASMHWASINGELVQRGFRWEDQPLGAALDAIYAVVVSRLEKKPLEEFLALLDNEAATTGKVTGRQRARITQDFSQLAGPRPTGGVRATGAPSDSGRPKTRTRPRPPRQADP